MLWPTNGVLSLLYVARCTHAAGTRRTVGGATAVRFSGRIGSSPSARSPLPGNFQVTSNTPAPELVKKQDFYPGLRQVLPE